MQCRDTTALDGAERALELDTIGDEFVKDVAHGQDRRVLGERNLTPSDDVLDRESHRLRLQPILLPAKGEKCGGSVSTCCSYHHAVTTRRVAGSPGTPLCMSHLALTLESSRFQPFRRLSGVHPGLSGRRTLPSLALEVLTHPIRSHLTMMPSLRR